MSVSTTAWMQEVEQRREQLPTGSARSGSFSGGHPGAVLGVLNFKGYVNVGPEIYGPGCLKYPDSHQKYVAIDWHRCRTVWQF